MIVCIGALATGGLAHVHNQAHEHEDAALVEQARRDGESLPHSPVHDETNCDLHAQLHLPLLSAGYVPLLILFGIFVAFLTLLPASVISYRPQTRLGCRGPPGC